MGVHWARRWRLVRVTCLALVMMGCLAARAAAPLTPPGNRPATSDDLLGLWKVMRWHTNVPVDRLKSYAAPYQYFAFGSDGSLRSATSRQPTQDLTAIANAVELQPAVTRYACSDNGFVEIVNTGWPDAPELWHAYYVNFTSRDAEGHFYLRAGDIVMTLLDNSGRPLYVRQMRQLGAPEPPELAPR